jgi:hypothetical protein
VSATISGQNEGNLTGAFYSLRSIVRSLLATSPPSLASAFTTTARSRLRQTNAKSPALKPYPLFVSQSMTSPAAPTQHLHDVLRRARSLYGAGLGFSSLNLLTTVIRASIGLRWEEDDEIADLFAIVDADIGQAIQVSLCYQYALRLLDLLICAEFKRRNRRRSCK